MPLKWLRSHYNTTLYILLQILRLILPSVCMYVMSCFFAAAAVVPELVLQLDTVVKLNNIKEVHA